MYLKLHGFFVIANILPQFYVKRAFYFIFVTSYAAIIRYFFLDTEEVFVYNEMQLGFNVQNVKVRRGSIQ